MTGRSKWDDFNNSSFDEDEANERGKLDHCRLYITNIPKALNWDGLIAAFEKFGTLKEAFMSSDPQKKYGIVRYETSSEAKLAMMKMNRTEPLKLCVSIAYKKKTSDNKDNRQTDAKYDLHEEDRRNDNASVSSRGRNTRREDMANGSTVEDNLPLVEDKILTEALDSSLDLKLESLKLEQLKLREEQLQCKHRILMIQQAELAEKRQASQSTSSNRCILPNGKIVVRNVSERLLEGRDGDVGYAAGAGDSLKIPGLQREASRACIQCGRPAEAFCAKCRLTPYCSEMCQRRDWNERHKAVCHNLARLAASGQVVKDAEEIPISSGSASARLANSLTAQTKRETARRDDPEQDRGNKTFIPPDHKAVFSSAPGYRPNNREPRNNTASSRGKQETKRPPSRRPAKDQPDEDWGNANITPIQQQPEVLSPKRHNTEQQKPTPRPKTTSNSSPSVKTEETVKRSPPKAGRQPAKQPAQTLQNTKDTQPDVVPIVETVKVALPSTNNVGAVPSPVLVPKTYLIEELSIGDVALLSVDSKASECRTKQPGHVCLSMHEKFESDFDRLCSDYAVDCEADVDYRPKPGDVFSYLNPEDGGWYRARGLTPTLAALIDSCKLVTITPTEKCKKLPSKYADIPEFCCLLDRKDVKVGSNLRCTLVSKIPGGFKVSIQDVEAGVDLGEGVVKRWLPEVEYPAVSTSAAVIPEVCRPAVVHNSRVLLVDATAPDRLVVRPADLDSQKQFDAVLQDVLLYGIQASPMTESPTKGQTVVGKYTDGLHYRALCRRTNVKQNKYQLEYLEYGNIEVSKLEMLYPCPENLNMDTLPTLASVVTLGLEIGSLTPSAEQYLEALKDEEMILSIPNGAKTAPSGSAVTLTLVKNNEVLNRKVEELCTPEWKKIEERGGSILGLINLVTSMHEQIVKEEEMNYRTCQTECLMYNDLEYMALPAAGCTVEILDASLLPRGSVSGYEIGLQHAHHVFTKLTQRMGEYCASELCRDPYLPRAEELCIAQYPPTGQWYRAVLMQQVDGPGGDKARVLYVDYGYVSVLPVALLRKMLPEFVNGLPAVANQMDIKDFPESPTEEMMERAHRYMKMTDAGRGQLKLLKCERQEEDGLYTVHAPDLLKAMYSE